ncbi:MAG: magnesium transporter CorA family protein [Chloroflexi bacterium]|nr:magnesium transporter CorA family protein [Chloroflexota bacterium]
MPTSLLTHGRVTWTNIVKPTQDDINGLSARYPQFHPLNLKDCLSELEFPKLDHHDDYLFMVVQMPVHDDKAQFSRPVEVDIFVARGTLVTSHSGQLPPLDDLFTQAQKDADARERLMGRGASPLLYHLLDAFIGYNFPLVQRLDHEIHHIEDNLFSNDTRHILNEIALVRRELIALRRILRPQLDVIASLATGNWPFIHDDLTLYWGDINDRLKQTQSMLDEHIEVVDGLSDTIDTLASHRIDEVVRVLTIITVLTLPLTLLSTIFSMNVVLPFKEHPASFYVVIAFGVALTAALVWYLRQRRWL